MYNKFNRKNVYQHVGRLYMRYSVKDFQTKKEDQTFERKSARKNARGLSNSIVAFENADGGILVVGIEDDGRITGTHGFEDNVNEILRVPFDFCKPSVFVHTEKMSCTDKDGKPNHLLVMDIPQSTKVHSNQQDEVYYRMGDKSKKLNFDERLQLLYSKGLRHFEDEPVAGSSVDDIDMGFLSEYCKKIGYKKSPKEYLVKNRGFIVRQDGQVLLSSAAVLLFGKEPQRFFPRSRIRFIRYEGTEALVGTEMNVIKDISFSGRILDVIKDALEFVGGQIKERKKLGVSGKFETVSEYPEFAWKELIVNAVAHRDYSITGTDIQIKMFDNRITVESPGALPGIVRLSNMRHVHFSRNPKIAQFLHEYSYVQEFGEGVDRTFDEMEKAGLPDPEYKTDSFMLYATIRNSDRMNKASVYDTVNDTVIDTVNDIEKNALEVTSFAGKVYNCIKLDPNIGRDGICAEIGCSLSTVARALKLLKKEGFIEREGSDKKGRWKILK